MITKSQAIANFLRDNIISDLSSRYNIFMECQVNVARDGGEPISGEYHGKKWRAWTDGVQQWKSFRIPVNAATNPEFNDTPMTFDLSKHIEAIGLTGWNWKERKSYWIAFDFDSIANHQKGLTDEQLKEVLEKVKNIPWVQVRKSSSGKGYHLYVYFDPYVSTDNHHEHAALARSILSKISALTCFDFQAKVDIVGGNIWVWHRKMKGTDGFTVVQNNTECLSDIPTNWKDHLKVVKGIKKRIAPDFIESDKEDVFEQLCGQYLKVELDSKHKELIEFLQKQNDATFWWDSERHMIVTHTFILKRAHTELQLKGIFETDSKGGDLATQNCYGQPLRDGSWIIRRFSPGCSEHQSWNQDRNGWTRCFFNKEPDFETAARSKGGIDLGEGKGFQFKEAETALLVAKVLGANVDIPKAIATRQAVLKQQKDGKLIVEVDREKNDTSSTLESWAAVKTKWRKIYQTSSNDTSEVDIPVCDDTIRHVVSEIERSNIGWYLRAEDRWQREPLDHIRPFLKSQGYSPNLIEPIIGLCVQRSWVEVNRPFENEYVGNRDWNRRGAKLKVIPNPDSENLSYPSWNKILNHIGKNLDEALVNSEWAISNGILTGADYLKCWISAMFQYPHEPLPYLFLFGPQNSGKSILHEALSLLFDRGYIQSNQSLLSNSGFNGELANAILCYAEEIDLSKSKIAYSRIKDWVTSRTITIREMQKNAYSLPNCSHWIHCSNSHLEAPSFSGDTRITMIEVSELDITETIPKLKFMKMLQEEAPDFLASVMKLELPEPISRLYIPVITTSQKLNIENTNRSVIEQFIREKCFDNPGGMTKYSELYEAFQSWIPTEQITDWSKQKFGKDFPPKYPRGTYINNITFIGNITLDKVKPEHKAWTLNERGYLVESRL